LLPWCSRALTIFSGSAMVTGRWRAHLALNAHNVHKPPKPVQSTIQPGTVAVSYVFPNTSDIPQRGGLEDRWIFARFAGCMFVEVPADLIKNGSEVAATGQDICLVLSEPSIASLYSPTQKTAGTIPYILHTEPSIPRADQHKIRRQAELKWHDPAWVSGFVQMIVDISDFLGTPASKIEIHPGDSRNSYADIALAVTTMQERYEDAFHAIPEVLVENRTGQFISDGAEISRFWDYIKENNPDLIENFGIVLDVQQLFTVTKQDFLHSFYQIPSECLKGFHIHRLYKPPKNDDGIPCKEVFERIAGLPQDIIINPEIHHTNKVVEVIRFCEEMLNQSH
jgi:hypothetical protein